MVQTTSYNAHVRLPPLIIFKAQRRQICSLVVVLVAVGSLTVSLATRYSSPWDASIEFSKNHPDTCSYGCEKQRLAKNWRHLDASGIQLFSS